MRRLFLAVAMGFATVALAQQPQTLAPQPRIQSVFPIGAKLGTTVDVVVLGTDLDDATGLLFSHPGITGKYLPPPADPEPPKDPKKKDAPPAKMNKKAPPPTEAKFQIAVAATVPLGSYDVRVVNKWGVSNPRLFVVGDRPEINEKEPNNDVPEAQKIELGTSNRSRSASLAKRPPLNGFIAFPPNADPLFIASNRRSMSCQIVVASGSKYGSLLRSIRNCCSSFGGKASAWPMSSQ